MRLLGIALRNLLRARRRNALAGGTMALGTAALFLGSGLSDGIARQLTDNLVAVQTGEIMVARRRSRERPASCLNIGLNRAGNATGFTNRGTKMPLSKGVLMNSSGRLFLLAFTAILWTACASIKPPTVRVAGIHLDGISLTGARVDVGLEIRNVNPEDLQIERFDYEVKLNGKVLGHGFQSDPILLGGFKEDRVVSRLDVNFLRIPAAVKVALERDRVDAEVKGVFYVREGSGLRKIKFGSRSNVDLNRGLSRDRRE